jgi:hypothetical protein
MILADLGKGVFYNFHIMVQRDGVEVQENIQFLKRWIKSDQALLVL